MTPTVLLFDVDGTLILAGGAGRRALVRAFADELGRGDVAEAVDLRGRTDRAVFRELLAGAGEGHDPALEARLVQRYLERLPAELDLASGFRVLPAVREVIAAARSRPCLALGLGTGNLERGARLKLSRGGLADEFAFGGFGEDGEIRSALLQVGAQRGAERLGIAVEECRVVVIGDTPLDIEAAHTIGAECVAVSTGGYDLPSLLAAGADAAYESLASPGAAAAILGR
jgi:phosphoglycolate phosphatase